MRRRLQRQQPRHLRGGLQAGVRRAGEPIQAFDASLGVESCVLAFMASRPASEPGFYLARTEGVGRFQKYAISSYAVEAKPAGCRY